MRQCCIVFFKLKVIAQNDHNTMQVRKTTVCRLSVGVQFKFTHCHNNKVNSFVIVIESFFQISNKLNSFPFFFFVCEHKVRFLEFF
eukprot:14979.XXX_279400_279657_1 [CDS] Oithona nana genome sequencing.